MLIKRAPDVSVSEITDERLYWDRRQFLRAVAGTAVGAAPSGCLGPAPSNRSPPRRRSMASGRAGSAPPNRRTQSTTSRATTTSTSSAWTRKTRGDTRAASRPGRDGQGGRRGRQAGRLRHRRPRQPEPARGTRLPVTLCRGLVDGHPLGRVPAGGRAEESGADVTGEIRRVHHAAAPVGDARSAHEGSAVAVRRGTPPGRGDAPADDPGGGSLWADPAQPERRAAPPRGALEVRLQEHQVDRPHLAGREAAADLLEPLRSRGIRLLLERQPGRGPPALEPGARAAHRRVLPPADAAVQRLRRPGGGSLHRMDLRKYY